MDLWRAGIIIVPDPEGTIMAPIRNNKISNTQQQDGLVRGSASECPKCKHARIVGFPR
jgi:hypothetical protein